MILSWAVGQLSKVVSKAIAPTVTSAAKKAWSWLTGSNNKKSSGNKAKTKQVSNSYTPTSTDSLTGSGTYLGLQQASGSGRVRNSAGFYVAWGSNLQKYRVTQVGGVNTITINQQKVTLPKGTTYYDSDGNVVDSSVVESSGSGGTGTGTGSSSGTAVSSATPEELEEIESMLDSNTIVDGVPKRKKANDIWNKAASKAQKSYWQLNEEVFVYTFHDKQKHEYLTSFQIDCDKNDICTTCSINVPYDNDLMEYWVPGQTSFALIGGVYDREVLFVGRCSEVNQSDLSIEIVGQNVGWKFKQYMKSEFYDKLKGLKVKNAVKMIFKELGFEKGRYHINLSGIPNIDEYILDEQCSVKQGNDTVENVPDLTQVVSNLEDEDIESYIANKMEMDDTQSVANSYEKKKEMRNLNSAWKNQNEYYLSSIRKNYGVEASLDANGNIVFDPIIDNFFEEGEGDNWFIEGNSYDGDYTYEEVIHSIASAIDAHFYIIDTTVCFVSFNALFALDDTVTIQKAIAPRVDFWQLEEDSYVLDVNQYGFYNTVKVNYKNGSVTKAYDDLVRVYGEVMIEYDEPELSYSAAMLKAQAYLSAHIRDFGMTIQCTILYTGKIVPSTFIKVKNPLTMSDNLFYVYGISVSWDADSSTIYADLDLRYGPENPDDPEIPEVGGTGYTNDSSVYGGDVSADVAQAAQQICMGATDATTKGQRIYNWVDANIPYDFYWNSRQSTSTTLQGTAGNCYDIAILIYELCSAAGVKCELWHGNYRFRGGSVIGHYWNMIEQNGTMVFADTGFGSSGTIVRNPLGDYHGGGAVSSSCVKKNY